MKGNDKRLNKYMDNILAREEAGIIPKQGNRALHKFFSNKIATLGLVLFGIIVFMCIAAPVFTEYDPQAIDLRNILSTPTKEHLLGTDKTGRDVFARILYGGRVSIFIGFGSALGVTILGVFLGCISGYKGGKFDMILMRISELFGFFPQIILNLLMVTMVGQGVSNLIFVFIFTGWGGIYRMMRAQMLSLREEEYVQALKVQGLSTFKICFFHILPNAFGPVIVNVSNNTADFILSEAALSFMGLGVPMNTPTWGNILNVANDLTVLKDNWWLWLPVGAIISLFVLSINFIGDGLRDSADPSQQG